MCSPNGQCDKQVTHLAAAAAMAAEWTGSSPTAVTRLCDNTLLLQSYAHHLRCPSEAKQPVCGGQFQLWIQIGKQVHTKIMPQAA